MIETIIIATPKDPAESISDTPGRCPDCGTWIAPEKQERLYRCPECDYEGEIEEWYRN